MKKILIIEDYKLARELFQTLLTDKGYEVDTAIDAEEGLEKAKINNYDFVLIDLILPRMSSYTLISEMKTLSKNTSVEKIGIMYTIGSENLLEPLKALEVSKFILKSTTDQRKVIEEVQKVLEKKFY